EMARAPAARRRRPSFPKAAEFLMSIGAEVARVEAVSKAFGVVQALTEVSLSFRTGEILALVGENGAGKSTLMRLLEGVHTPDAGRIVVAGEPQRFQEPREA